MMFVDAEGGGKERKEDTRVSRLLRSVRLFVQCWYKFAIAGIRIFALMSMR